MPSWSLIVAIFIAGALLVSRARSRRKEAKELVEIGISFIRGDSPDNAIIAFDDALDYFGRNIPDEWVARIFVNRSRALYNQGKFDAAIAICEEVVRRFDKDNSMRGWVIFAFNHKADALDGHGKLDDAVTAYGEAISRFDQRLCEREAKKLTLDALMLGDPIMSRDVAVALICKGDILTRQAKLDAAIAAYEEVERLFGEDSYSLILALINKGSILEQQAKLDAALAIYEEIDRRFGNDDSIAMYGHISKALSNKVAVLKKQGKLDAATAFSEEIERRFSEGDTPGALYRAFMEQSNKAQALERCGDFDAAIAVYKGLEHRFIQSKVPDARSWVIRAQYFRSEVVRKQRSHQRERALADESSFSALRAEENHHPVASRHPSKEGN